MNLSFGDETREESYDPSYDAREGRYEGYREQDLPEGYAAYGQNGNAEAVYDRYDYDQDSEVGRRLKPSLCEKMKSICGGKTKQIKRTTIMTLCLGPSESTSNEYSISTTQLLCSDPNSSAAKSFQERNYLKSRILSQNSDTKNFIDRKA